MRGLSGRTIVVSGAASGIGAAVATVVAAAGARMIGLDLEPADDVRTHDVTSESAWAALAAELAEAGPVHGLVSCAGATWRARLGDVTAEAFARVHAVNVIGPLLGTQSLVPLMPSGASIVHVGSVAALQGHYPIAYTSSKWALRGLTHSSCLELGPAGIRVNLVHPGFIDTAMTRGADSAFRAASVEQAPLGRTGTAEEVASVVEFLLGDAAAYISGAEIPIDGGTSSHAGAKSVSDAMRQTYQAPPIPSH